MQILKIKNEDFDLLVECNNLDKIFEKAKSKQDQILTSTNYLVSSGEIELLNITSKEFVVIDNKLTHPVFFENNDYFFGITFKNKASVKDPLIFSKLKDLESKFYYREELGFLSGTINFGNDLGNCNFIIDYNIDGQNKRVVFNFEVFPTKLNYRSDYTKMIDDIEKEYPNLVLDFLKKTYSSFKSGGSKNTDLIWWQVFGGLYEQFISASKFILNKPHSRIVHQIRHEKADHIIRWTSNLEEEFCQFKHLPNKNYRSEYKILSTNTLENRFFKYAIIKTLTKYKKIKNYIIGKFKNDITDRFKNELFGIEKQLEIIYNSPFFKTIGDFKGMKQESLVLQKGTGYNMVYKSWVMLNSGLKFLDGIQKIELKNIADLYQIWCFLEMKGVLQKILGKDNPDDIDLAQIEVDDFVFKIERGVKSRVSFKQPNGDVIDLFYDFSYDNDSNKEVKSFTVNQRPDIVLRITKNDLKDSYAFTYLYDAKYRLASDDKEGSPDLPTEDAINQMHRYRDAIYYVDKNRNKPEKEVIGGYILFPGTGDKEEIKKSDFYKSISDVNIGAFPLRPNDNINKELLEEHLKGILKIDTESTLIKISPQKDMKYENSDPVVLAGFTRKKEQANYLKSTRAEIYHIPKQTIKHLNEIKYFAPIIDGIEEYFEVDSIEMLPRNKIFLNNNELASNSTDLYYIFRLKNRKKLMKKIESARGGNVVFRYARLSELKSCRSISDFKKIKQEV